MHLLLVGMDHHTAPLAEREALALGEVEARAVLERATACPEIRESVVLSTCNRTEFYVATDDVAAARRALRGVVEATRGLDLLAPTSSLYERTDALAVTHLFRVASGIESMIVGEPQILSQVKDAHAHARSGGATGPWLDRLFESALRTGKRARAETAIGVGVVSVASAACELARRHIDRLDERSVLVIGVGETSRIAATHVTHYSPRVTIANRTLDRARALADQIGASAIGLDDLPNALASADLVFTATSAPHRDRHDGGRPTRDGRARRPEDGGRRRRRPPRRRRRRQRHSRRRAPHDRRHPERGRPQSRDARRRSASRRARDRR